MQGKIVTSEILDLFVEKAYKLDHNSFWLWVADDETKTTDYLALSRNDFLHYSGVSEEALDSYCLHLRSLKEPRDGFSFQKISEFYKSRNSDAHLKIEEQRNQLKAYLDQKTFFNMDGKILTKGEVFDIVFYGHLVHKNPEKRAIYKRFLDASIGLFLVFSEFENTLKCYRNCYISIAQVIVEHEATC